MVEVKGYSGVLHGFLCLVVPLAVEEASSRDGLRELDKSIVESPSMPSINDDG